VTLDLAAANMPPRHLPRSLGAIGAGTLAVIVLSLGIDQLLHVAHVYPPWGYAMPEPGLNLLALSYRCAFNVVGAYLTARLAPRNPGRHLVIFASIGFALGTVGAIATIPMHLGPSWYPIGLALSAWPCTWLGWVAYRAATPPTTA
jgi:hypothetical protein